MLPLLTIAAMSGPPGERITLSGANGSPNEFFDSSLDPFIARVEWEFRTNGQLWAERSQAADIQYLSGIQWCNQTPVGDYWIKATQSGLIAPGQAPNIGDTLDTWHRLDGFFRSWGWQVQGGFEFREGYVRVDIATDAAGTNIIATGYYGGNVDSEI